MAKSQTLRRSGLTQRNNEIERAPPNRAGVRFLSYTWLGKSAATGVDANVGMLDKLDRSRLIKVQQAAGPDTFAILGAHSAPKKCPGPNLFKGLARPVTPEAAGSSPVARAILFK
jgi:hypothetical protein